MNKIKDIVSDEARLLLLKKHLGTYRDALIAKNIAVNGYKLETRAQAVAELGIEPALFDALVKAEADGEGKVMSDKARDKAQALAFYHDFPLYELLEDAE